MDFNSYRSAMRSHNPTWDGAVLNLSEKAAIAIKSCRQREAACITVSGEMEPIAAGASYRRDLADLLYAWSELVASLGFSPEAVAQANLQKLLQRQMRGTLQGSGDDR